MRTDTTSVIAGIEHVYANGDGDVPFAHIAKMVDPDDDGALSELIEADGRHRIALGRSVDLERYLQILPDLPDRPDPLDAAIDVTLRSLSGSSRVEPSAVEGLVQRHPNLEQPIREAAMLNAAIWSTTGFRARIEPPPVKPLPCDFGPPLPSGERRYQLQKFLGQGGFGQVYLAHDRQLSEKDHTATVAIKILASSAHMPWIRQRLIEEATKVRRISHPNVVMVIDRGVSEENEDYIVYEFVDGGDLTLLAIEGRPLPIEQTVRLISKTARGVHAAHSAGVIHCDLKPSNIMLTSAGEPKVADFGVAVRVAREGATLSHPFSEPASAASGSAGLASAMGPIGNVAFISPEQYRGEDGGLSVQSDVYALGGMLYLMLTGRLPNGATKEEIAATHDREHGRIKPPSARAHRPLIDRDLDAICARAMAVDPHERYESAAAFAEDLDRWLQLEPIPWMKPGVGHRLRLWTRRKPALAASVGGMMLVAMAGVIIALRLMSLANQNAIAAAVAQKELESKHEIEQNRLAFVNKFRQSLKTSLGEYKFATDALAFVWALEYIYGPTVMNWPEQSRELWKDRVGIIRTLVQTAHAENRGDELETLLWETALGFWLVSGKDYQEAEPLLDATLQRWSQQISPDDPWLSDVRTMRICAQVNRYAAWRRAGSSDAPSDEELRRVQGELLAACELIPANRRGTPLHLLLINTMIDLCAPDMLNDSNRRQSLETAAKVLIDRKPADRPCG